MSRGADAVAAAIVAATDRPEPFFPAVGVVAGLRVQRPTGGGQIVAITGLSVDVNGESLECGWSGAFAAEIETAAAAGLAEQYFVGRKVKVELVGGDYLVAYTVNWS